MGLCKSIHERADSTSFSLLSELAYLPKPQDAVIAHGPVTAPGCPKTGVKGKLSWPPGQDTCLICRHKPVRGFVHFCDEKTFSP